MGATTYQLADDAVVEILRDVLHKHHNLLFVAGVTVSAVMAAKETKGESVPALKRNGLDIAAKIQVSSLADRARGIADAKLTIDRYAWDRFNDLSRVALLDHELEHLRLVDDGADDLGRPRLNLRPHDWELTGFADVMQRHGEAALESQQIAKFRADFAEQLSLW